MSTSSDEIVAMVREDRIRLRRVSVGVIAGIALLVVALGSWLVLALKSPASKERSTPQDRSPGGDSTIEAPAQRPERGAVGRDAEPMRLEASRPDLDKIPGPIDGILVEGTIVVVDDDDVEHPAGSGSLRASSCSKTSREELGAVPVRAGNFWVRVPKDTLLGIDDLVIDGEKAFVEPEITAIQEGMTPRIRARIRVSHEVLLHVVDAISKEELQGVAVVAGLVRSEDRTMLIERGASPIRVTVPADEWSKDGHASLSCCAPGHAWGEVSLCRTIGREWLELNRGGNLEVTVLEMIETLRRRGSARSSDSRRHDPQLMICLRLVSAEATDEAEAILEKRLTDLAISRNEDARRWTSDQRLQMENTVRNEMRTERLERLINRRGGGEVDGPLVDDVAVPNDNGPTLFDGLSLGYYLVTLESGGARHRHILARTEADVSEDVTAHAVLACTARNPSRRIPLAGVVLSSDRWKSKSLELFFEPVKPELQEGADRFELWYDNLTPIEGEPGHYRFDAGEVAPGRYLVTCQQLQFQQIIDTGHDGTHDAVISIGDPAEVVVHLLDGKPEFNATTGKLICVFPVIKWRCALPAESSGLQPGDDLRDESLQARRFRAPAGTVDVFPPNDPRWNEEPRVFEPSRLDVKPGLNEVTLRVCGGYGVFLRFTIDGATLRPRDIDLDGLQFSFALASVEDPMARTFPVRALDDALYFVVGKPGRYVVKARRIEGFDEVAPFELEVGPGKNSATVLLRRPR